MMSPEQEIENMEYVRRLLEQKQPGFAARLEFAAALVKASGLDVVEVQKMEPMRAHEVIGDRSLVHEWRVAQLTRLGLPTPLAEAVAADVDWHQVAALVHRGCPPRLALRIVQ